MKSQFCKILAGVFGLRCRICAAALALVGLGQLQPLRAVTLADFGYAHCNVNGKPAVGAQPLLLICVSFDGQPALPQPLSYFSNLVFNAAQSPSMNGFYQACSAGAFSLAPAGAIQLHLSASEDFMTYSNLYDPFVRDEVYGSNIIAHAMASGLVDFAMYDLNHDGHITPDELAIMVLVSDNGWPFGGSRTTHTVVVPGLNYDWGSGPNEPNPNFALLGTVQANFMVLCEEVEETWGAIDIYGPANLSMSLSSQSTSYDSTTFLDPDQGWNSYYLDPYNRMELGWCVPRIYSLTDGGMATISAAQAGDFMMSPILLYDPAQGPGEFFILEYRTCTNSVYGSGYDQDAGVFGGNPITFGLVIWHVQQDANFKVTHVTSPAGVTNTPAIWAENSPDLIPRSMPSLWGSGSTTPNLRWINGTPTLTTIHVRPFNPGDNSITVEWLSAKDTWVDFNFTGSESGTFDNPFKTMTAGLNAVSYGGNLHIKSGSSSETPTITKPMKIVGYNGPATVGHH